MLAVSLVSKDDDSELPNLLEQYNRLMTDSERAALAEALTAERAYSDFVYSTYTATGGSAYIADLAATVRKTRIDGWWRLQTLPLMPMPLIPICVPSTRMSPLPGTATCPLCRHSLTATVRVRCVIDYIIRDLGCTYTITPDLSDIDASLDGVENFLRNTKQGYCVQFASAAAPDPAGIRDSRPLRGGVHCYQPAKGRKSRLCLRRLCS